MNHDKPVLKVEIDRGYWNRGARDHAALRMPQSRNMCATGFLCQAAGIPATRLNSIGRVDHLTDQDDIHIPKALTPFLTPLDGPRVPDERAPQRFEWAIPSLFYSVNDDPLLDDARREAMLARIAAMLRIELRFTGEALPRHTHRFHATWRPEEDRIPSEDWLLDVRCQQLDPQTRAWNTFDRTRLHLTMTPADMRRRMRELLLSHAATSQPAVRVTATSSNAGEPVFDAYSEARV